MSRDSTAELLFPGLGPKSVAMCRQYPQLSLTRQPRQQDNRFKTDLRMTDIDPGSHPPWSQNVCPTAHGPELRPNLVQ